MGGRQVGGDILFKGMTDLDECDSGAFDRVGRATGTRLEGIYASARDTGAFSLKRVAKKD